VSGAGSSAGRDAVRYVGRFAPTPSGPLHAGSLVAALASWLDARAHDGQWLVRIEDVDAPRCRPGAAQTILAQLAACGLVPDAPPLVQSTRAAYYQAALDKLLDRGWAYRCRCSRREVDAALGAAQGGRPRHAERIYPGTCRDAGVAPSAGHAVRVLAVASTQRPLEPLRIDWHDRRLGAQWQDVTAHVGDFVLRRADGWWAYQLAVVVDDAAQGVSHVVRGEDLADNTPRQIHLQRLLGVPTPVYLHTPLVRGSNGEKLAKGNGARAVDLHAPAAALRQAAAMLGLELDAGCVTDLLAQAVTSWRARWMA
jgi:glutamyl-Q tRNA(Asp) synthetase